MSLIDFIELLKTIDPNLFQYYSDSKENYTVWRQYGVNRLIAENRTREKAVKIQIDRFTKDYNDPIPDRITQMLEDNQISYDMPDGFPDYEIKTGYVHHLWECEV